MTQTTTTTKSNSKPRATKKDKKGGAALSLLKNPGVSPREDLIAAALDHYEVAHGADVAENVAKLRDASAAVAEANPDACVNCDNCGDFSEESVFDICPFCGHNGGVVESPAPAAAETSAAEETASEPAPVAAVVVPSADAVGELTRRTERVRGLMRDMAGNGYDLGLELAEIHGGDLWKAGGFDSFKAYCSGAAGVSHTLAYQLIEVATKTKREDFLTVGQTKLAIVVRAPESERAELLDAAKKGETAAKLQDRAKTARANAKAKASGKPAPAAKAPAQTAEVKRGRPREEDQTIRLAAAVNGRAKTAKWSKQAGKKREEIAVWGGAECFAVIPVATGIELVVKLALNRKNESIGIEYVYTRTGE